MSALCYISMNDVPAPLIASARYRVDEVTHARLVGFDGCPLIGQMEKNGEDEEIEFSFPRAAPLRNDLVAWLLHWGICFRVVM